MAALDWSAALLDSISDASEAVRRESDRAVKLLAHERALSTLKPELSFRVDNPGFPPVRLQGAPGAREHPDQAP